jgi:voltage-gated potassium channel
MHDAHPITHHHRHRLLRSIVCTGCLLALISLAIGGSAPGIATATLGAVIGLAVTFHLLLPGSDFFSIVFANSIGVYACLFVFLTSANFSKVTGAPLDISFVMPLVTFLIGILWRRKEIASLVHSRHGVVGKFNRLFVWTVPLVTICALTFILPIAEASQRDQNTALLYAMAAISLVGFLGSRDISVFLLDIGLLFEDFFVHAMRLLKPAFALLTCSSLTIITFASLYTIIDRFAATPHFTISGAARKLTLADGLYLSVSTLSTAGYSDIIATTSIGRLLMAAETFCGVTLLLFGVEAILASGRQK